MTLNAKLGGFMDFLERFRAATQVYIIHKVEPWNYHYVHFGMTVKKVLYFIPNSRILTQTTIEIFVVQLRFIVSTIIYYLVHF